MDWTLECSGCGKRRDAGGLPTVCEDCGSPWLVRYAAGYPAKTALPIAGRGDGMWRYRALLPLREGERPVTLGEGGTPLLPAPRLGAELGSASLSIKDEAANPTGSFKARGLSAAVTRAVAGGAARFVLPTAGNAGVAAAAYGARAGVPVKVFAPRTTPAPLLGQIAAYGADLELVDGHIGDCGARARQYAAERAAMDLSTLREPYRIEGKKTLGLEIAEQMGWRFPGAIIYPAGGGTGLVGMWKAFGELIGAGWLSGPMPRLFAVQSAGCAPVVRAWEAGADRCEPWPNPETVASGLRVPAPLGGALMLQALRESGGGAVAVSDPDLSEGARLMAGLEGIDACPEGGAAVAAARKLLAAGVLSAREEVVVFNTGAGVLYGRDLK
ncbi:MAG TPA: threonine synthase [Gemmatimonadales bacterium]|nr:threonine synthase [Gemmatimonadales bacterium]